MTPLVEFLAAVRRVVVRRELAAASLWSLAALGGLSVVAAGLAGWSLRGDLARPVWLLAAALTGAGVVLHGHRRARMLAGTPHRTAGTIAQIRRPLIFGAGADPPTPRDVSLRREILGAAELMLADPRNHAGSDDLAALFVEQVGRETRRYDPRLAAPPARVRAPALAASLALLLGAALAGSPEFARGIDLLIAGADGRPEPPPEPVWSALSLTLRAPFHSGRPPRHLVNPSGALRSLAGTEVDVELAARRPAAAIRLTIVHEPGDPPPPPAEVLDMTLGPDGKWRGRFTLRGPGSWHVVAEPEDGGPPLHAAAMPLELEPDEAPEVELLPLPRSRSDPSELDAVDLRFKARDDFGLASAALVFEGEDGAQQRLDAGAPPARARAWNHRYTWDLRGLPVKDRGQLTYWIEVRDNDPGLGLVPLPEPPGKVARSARMTLKIRDQEAEHAENLADLAALRDAAVDLLAGRMVAEEPELARAAPAAPAAPEAAPPTLPLDLDALDRPAGSDAALHRGLAELRGLLAASEALLAALSAAIDGLSVDTLAPKRDAAALIAIHKRLIEIHRREAAAHAELPRGAEYERPAALPGALTKLGALNREQRAQLEDEIIRLDDLVDDGMLAQVEQLVARLQASQQKLVDLLEKLRAGDESVRGEIEQLQQRIREDLRRLAEARARLDKEVGREFLNVDAFERMAEQVRQQDVSEQLRSGDVEGALRRARDVLGELQRLRRGVQDRMSDRPDVAISPEERAKLELTRELSRLQDEETGLRSESRALHERWRQHAGAQPLDPATAQQAARQAVALEKQLAPINDARLGRDARRALEDAREQLARLQGELAGDAPKALPAAEAAREAARALERALAGAGEGSSEKRQLGPAREQGQRLSDLLGGALPGPDAGLDEGERGRLGQLSEQQLALQRRAEELMRGPNAGYMPEPGKEAMRGATREMESSAGELARRRPGSALDRQAGALGGLQRAIESLRDSSAAPQASYSPDEASTETERDRSLRDELMEAMKERAPEGFRDSVERYYEELLR